MKRGKKKMKAKVIGYSYINYQKKDGKQVNGVELHYTTHDKNVVGEKVATVFIGQNVDGYGDLMRWVDGSKIIGKDVMMEFDVIERGTRAFKVVSSVGVAT